MILHRVRDFMLYPPRLGRRVALDDDDERLVSQLGIETARPILTGADANSVQEDLEAALVELRPSWRATPSLSWRPYETKTRRSDSRRLSAERR